MEPHGRQIELRLRLPGWKIITIIVVILLVIAGGVFAATKLTASNTSKRLLPQELRDQASFPLYYPTKLPSGFDFDKGPALYGAGVVSFGMSNDKGEKIVISEQAKPENLNFDDYYKKNVEVRQQKDIPIGKVTIGSIQAQPAASIVTDTTWILIVTPGGGIDDSQLLELAENITPR